ncbi:MAG TPA: bacillithiol biosynthesis deacetylase BshB1, partial [Nitrospinaceae bacterium]|nr:bacillithiol biosynthesis deacetylase BshB1 [Nitrospinaceae bacterium]
MRDSIVIIGPHPDDVFISCAGLVLKHLDDYDFKVVCMTSQGHLGSGADSPTRLK